MRLWHKDLIPVLPKQQLIAQWRECCCIARNIAVNGTPNHILVNKVLNYSQAEFMFYCGIVTSTIITRGYRIKEQTLQKFMENMKKSEKYFNKCSDRKGSDIFYDWHNTKYLVQCYYNLQEKYDCGGIPEEEWVKLDSKVRKIMNWRLI